MDHVLAATFLAVVALVPAVWYVVVMSRAPFTPLQWTLRCLSVLLVRLLWRAKLSRDFPVEDGQGAVIICNHRSSVDPFFVQAAIPRPVYWMVAREYCEHVAFRWFLKSCSVIPVGRGGVDTAAIKTAIRLVRRGNLVGMLPEGRINMTDRFMLPARPGSVLVAMKAGAPVVPCYIDGAPFEGTPWSPFLMPARVRLRFGDSIELSDCRGGDGERGVVARLMLECLQAIARLAGRDDFRPTLAGRRWKPTQEELDELVESNRRRRMEQRST